MKHANYFVFTSYYEAFGLVLAEANILGIPVMSTNILGPRGFMMKYGGLLVDNSEEGIYQGMKELLTGNTQIMKVNYQKYNEEAQLPEWPLSKEKKKQTSIGGIWRNWTPSILLMGIKMV